ncbi:MAG: hypothetical protein JNK02_14880 [Planctomycetes bacterium]|nr:hypothetical protein [Planctomycetota bacterium]
MRSALLVLCCVCVAGLLALAFRALREPGAAPAAPVSGPEPAQDAARVAALERELSAIRAEVDALRQQPVARARTSTESAPRPAAVPASLDREPAWFLREYERSFEGRKGGSTYFRLAVEAFVVDLAPALARRLADRAADPDFRTALATIAGDRRLAGEGALVEALFAALLDARPEELGLAALESLGILGGAATGAGLEKAWPSLSSEALRERALVVILDLAAPEPNRALARLFARAAKPSDRARLVARASPDPAASALEVLRPASTDEETVRVAAAERLRALRGPAFLAFVEEWLGYERVERVRRLLGAAREELARVPNYAPEQAIGPPDAVAGQDHPKAWASSKADMGLQWLELSYAPPRRASGLRIHEVCVAGAVVRVIGIDAQGTERELWSGADPTSTPGVFALDFAATAWAVARVRIVLDTDRAAGWNEIDAVELVGPDGSAWATGAAASSWYGQR